MGVGKLIMAAAAWRFGRERPPQNNIEDGQSALLGSESPPSRLAAGISRQSYGATDFVGGSPGILGRTQSHSPETYCNGALARVPEDRVYEDPDTFDEEEFLEERGIYIGESSQAYFLLCDIFTYFRRILSTARIVVHARPSNMHPNLARTCFPAASPLAYSSPLEPHPIPGAVTFHLTMVPLTPP